MKSPITWLWKLHARPADLLETQPLAEIEQVKLCWSSYDMESFKDVEQEEEEEAEQETKEAIQEDTAAPHWSMLALASSADLAGGSTGDDGG